MKQRYVLVWTMYMDTKKMKYISAALFPDTAQRYNHYVSEDIQMYFVFAFVFQRRLFLNVLNIV